jgi:hypothetical protein
MLKTIVLDHIKPEIRKILLKALDNQELSSIEALYDLKQ